MQKWLKAFSVFLKKTNSAFYFGLIKAAYGDVSAIKKPQCHGILLNLPQCVFVGACVCVYVCAWFFCGCMCVCVFTGPSTT